MTIVVDTVREQSIEKNPSDRIGSQNKTEAPAKQSGAAKSAPCAPDNGGCRLVNCYGEVYPSRYNVFIALKKNRQLVYNAITGKLNVWIQKGTDVFNNFATLPCNELNKTTAARLLEGGYLVRKGQDQYADIKNAYEKHRFDTKSMTLSIAPTMSCNFGCDYCFQGDRKAKAVMKPAVQDALVDFVETSISNLGHLHTVWHGGEPMLRWRTIYKLADHFIDLCNANGVKYDAMMVTNGYLLTQEKAERLFRRRVKTIQVTLDGPPEQHNRRRPVLAGGPSFDTILANLKKIVGTIPITINIRINVDVRNCDMAGMGRLFQILADNGLAKKKGCGVYFAPVESMTQQCRGIAGNVLAREAYARQELELYKMAIHKAVSGYRYPPRFSGTCAAVRPNGYVVLPDGSLHKCWGTVSKGENAVGTLFDMDKVAENITYQSWLNWSPFEVEECHECQILPVCAGACAYKMLYTADTSGETAGLPCISWRYQIKSYLLMWAISKKMITLDDVLPSDLPAIQRKPAA